MDTNKKTFNLINRTQKSFNLFISNFAFAITLIFKIRNKIQISFVSQLISKASSIVRIKRFSISPSSMKLIGKIVSTIRAKRISLIIISKAIIKSVVILKNKNPIFFISSARQKIVSAIGIKKIKITSSILLGTFATLGTHDPSSLGTKDSSTLGAMDGSFT